MHTHQTHIGTWYGDISSELFEKLAQVQILFCDVDGVFSDGRIYLGNQGEELKAFHTRDGLGVKALMTAGVEVVIVTGRSSRIVEQRMQHLGVRHIIQGEHDKLTAMQRILKDTGIKSEHAAAIGDDLPDIPMLTHAHVGVAVYDAHPAVQQRADYVTQQRGGFGAVRELADLILMSQGKLHQVLESST
ncbi:3-deoxy-manno-octulosonate-8-phosphatase KdsC [Aliidiomarina sanyensis]|uniref:3-deoxy-D-manno-octulosonate 8-phosphate phosphatase KdsC n=1 Tax=Aliidiomarina sanyensis TaxID=1249555 RepID=A0A432WI07_9GAMM|nr:3-deoxy-manno-octulosonate-8-phosphatase KdsC [Aliidiomarina sanyensis]RUO33452.1 3-deoxy-manno-octulosonate-8-phosphatase KdsC [Aliidiomarina sanyensis]